MQGAGPASDLQRRVKRIEKLKKFKFASVRWIEGDISMQHVLGGDICGILCIWMSYMLRHGSEGEEFDVEFLRKLIGWYNVRSEC